MPRFKPEEIIPVEVTEEKIAKTEKSKVAATAVEETLFPFSVIIDGQDRTILAKDADDLQVRIARIRAS